MRLLPALLMLALLAITPLAAQADGEPATLFANLTLVNGDASPPQPGMAILVRGERIEAVGPVGQVQAAGAKVVDMKGAFVTPGLINTHVHLATPPMRRYAEAMLRRDLYGGITAERDMADDLRQVADLARAARVGEIPGPDIYYAALFAGPEFFEDPRTQAVTAGETPGKTPWMRAVDADTDLRQAVAEAKGTGATAIKIYADLSAERVAAITAEAHRQGLKVWAHAAVFPASPAEVLAAGVDGVSHVCMLAYQVSDKMPLAYHRRPNVQEERLAAGDDPTMAGLFETMKAKDQVLDATLWVYEELARMSAADPSRPKPYCSAPLAARLTNQAYRADVIITVGTDGFSPGTSPWPALQDEMQYLQDTAGLKPLDVLKAATLNGAKAVGREAEMGTITPGKLANLVFLTADPSQDVRAFRTVRLTVKRGVLFWRKDYRPVSKAETKDAE
ncbi:imidazolonepropionase-like amidohydrolase [Caulobacter ginsengisoli]|uniref:Imidazolonepropionase-like amidohydrolase n=1 Tax=Caulobacter ginsengisoli TaxID=400775 RepID=A0ABU0IM54_9CAUL|nr:amidohydrolase family protein [Caulobacter ginsengisoli]MDQ0463103.1 imidazolonepropionase-like amidohydrolase [Caulobacter ginsengisoli]